MEAKKLKFMHNWNNKLNCDYYTTIRLIQNGNATGCAENLQEQLHAIKQDLELLSSVMREFEFYHTRFDGRKVVPTDGA